MADLRPKSDARPTEILKAWEDARQRVKTITSTIEHAKNRIESEMRELEVAKKVEAEAWKAVVEMRGEA